MIKVYNKKGVVVIFCDLNFMKTAELKKLTLKYTKTNRAVPYLGTMFN